VIRVVLTVLVTVALLATAMPALEDAQTATATARLETETDRIERAVGGLVSGSTSVSDPSLAARTTVTVRAPAGVAAPQIDRLALVEPARSDADAALRYRIDGGRRRTLSIAPESAVATVEVVDGPIALRTRGESRLELRLVGDGEPTVRVTRVG